MVTLAYVLLCLCGIVALILVLGSTMEMSYFLMQSKPLKFYERDYFKTCRRVFAWSFPCCILCIYLLNLLLPKTTNELQLSMVLIVVAATGFVIGVIPPFLNEEKRVMRKRHHLF